MTALRYNPGMGLDYTPDRSLPILERTPAALRALLAGLPEEWVRATDGPGTWSAFDVVGHLIHGEKGDWISRARHILEKGDSEPFQPFDREAMFEESRGKTMDALLEEFASLRAGNVAALRALALTPEDLDRRGLHPALGTVTLRQHLATWVAHDMGHLRQIAQTLGRQYRDAVGPWRVYLSMMK
ncbi:MAG: DinB family protein [Bacteroidota bacterium]